MSEHNAGDSLGPPIAQVEQQSGSQRKDRGADSGTAALWSTLLAIVGSLLFFIFAQLPASPQRICVAAVIYVFLVSVALVIFRRSITRAASAVVATPPVILFAAAYVIHVLASQDIALDLGDGVFLTMRSIPHGTLVMGASEIESQASQAQAHELPRHKVTISDSYWMGETEVTREQFEIFQRETGHLTTAERWKGSELLTGTGDTGREVALGANWREPGFEQEITHPVVCVSWEDAKSFCRWLTKISDMQVDLPTEAQWEYACRSGSATRFAWGNTWEQGNGWANAADLQVLRRHSGWTVFPWDDSYYYTAPVARFRPNEFGLYDMHGNVWEWCRDWYGDYSQENALDPTGPALGRERVVRGGGWIAEPKDVRSGKRDKDDPFDSANDLGFRVVATMK